MCTDLETIFLVRPAGSFFEANYNCIGSGGQLSEPAVINEKLLTIARGINDTCLEWDGVVSWLTHTMSDPEDESKFCEALKSDGKVVFVTCIRRLACSLCIAQIQRFTAYGHDGDYFNYIFFLYSDSEGIVVYKGVQGSEITRANDTWLIKSNEHTTTMSTNDVALPIGRRKWQWDSKIPGMASELLLAVTVCRTSEFSCEDGQCIPIVQRCDDVMHCRDGSDEKSCNIIKISNSYDSSYVPPLLDEEVVPAALGYHIDMYNLGRITTDEGNFDAQADKLPLRLGI